MTELIWQGKYDENGKRIAPLLSVPPIGTDALLAFSFLASILAG